MGERATTAPIVAGVRTATWVRSGRRESRGAALTEFAILTIILVPLLFGTAMIGKLIEVRQTAVQASRYAVWETTVHGVDAPASSVAERFFGEHAAVLSSAPYGAASADADPEGRRAAPADAARGIPGDTRVVVRGGAVAEARDASVTGPRNARATGEAVAEAGRALGSLTDGEWELPGDGFVRRGVTVPVERTPWLANATGGCGAGQSHCLSELSVIMSDGWSVAGTEESERRVRSLVPASALDAVGTLLSEAGRLPVLKELRGLDNALGAVDAITLPPTESGVRTLDPYAEGDTR